MPAVHATVIPPLLHARLCVGFSHVPGISLTRENELGNLGLSVDSPLEDLLMSQAAMCKRSRQKVCQMAWRSKRVGNICTQYVLLGYWQLGTRRGDWEEGPCRLVVTSICSLQTMSPKQPWGQRESGSPWLLQRTLCTWEGAADVVWYL